MFNLKSIVFGAAVVFTTSIVLTSCGDGGKAEAAAKALADSTRMADSLAMVEQTAKAEAEAAAAAMPKTISEVAGANADLSSLVGALTTAELVETLKGGAFTVFAPNNAAFEEAKAVVEKVSKDKAKLTSVLKFHVVEGPLKAADLTDGKELTTLNGEKLKVSVKEGKVMVNGAEVVAQDVAASNGVVHVINKVLVPKK